MKYKITIWKIKKYYKKYNITNEKKWKNFFEKYIFDNFF